MNNSISNSLLCGVIWIKQTSELFTLTDIHLTTYVKNHILLAIKHVTTYRCQHHYMPMYLWIERPEPLFINMAMHPKTETIVASKNGIHAGQTYSFNVQPKSMPIIVVTNKRQ